MTNRNGQEGLRNQKWGVWLYYSDRKELIKPITCMEVERANKELKNNTSAGTSNMPPEFLKHSPDIMVDLF